MQHCRPTDTPPMTIRRVTSPPQVHVFPTFHRSTFMTTRHPKPHWSRFLLTTTLTRRCIPTRTHPTHPNTPRMRHLRMRPEQTTLEVLPFGEAYVVNTGGLYSQRGLRHRLSYPVCPRLLLALSRPSSRRRSCAYPGQTPSGPGSALTTRQQQHDGDEAVSTTKRDDDDDDATAAAAATTTMR